MKPNKTKLPKKIRFKTEYAGRGGWSKWVIPINKGYLLQCCDCGLIHECQFKTFAESHQTKKGTFTVNELPPIIRTMFRMKRFKTPIKKLSGKRKSAKTVDKK